MIKEKLKFYADTPRGERNKFFCWEVSLINLEEAFYRFFARGFIIRAAWYENTNTETGTTENTRIPNIQNLFDKFHSLPIKKKQFYLKGQINRSNYCVSQTLEKPSPCENE